ncbi:hypothetical protein LPB86_04200 [Pedobacter sp. MC2016-14]|uniref:hypothetical protein n=1 Tax=Pedobacter sp. MC2016-14 TaxID=2897327 RepID=UPI001E391D56|nr:hypothetical protein [Pedobacter sp. MC2016-14]MCD0487416.1 hypothetical protein [Pedobacter sp. MC2016-14]
MKLTLTSILVLLSIFSGFSQSNFYKLGIGSGFGTTHSFTDVEKSGNGISVYGTADYFFTPFISMGVEGQIGQIAGGDVFTDSRNREFLNNYKSFTFNGKLYLGSIINYDYSPTANLLKGIYGGTGIGLIQNKIIAINRRNTYANTTSPGQNNSFNILVPLNLGINVYLADRQGDYRYVLNLNLQGNLTFGEGLDGYNDSSIRFSNNRPDAYSYISVGFKYLLGPMGLSMKTFRRP